MKLFPTPVCLETVIHSDDSEWFVICSKKSMMELSEEEYRKAIYRINIHDELVSAIEDVISISDRKHDAWDRAKAIIEECNK